MSITQDKQELTVTVAAPGQEQDRTGAAASQEALRNGDLPGADAQTGPLSAITAPGAPAPQAAGEADMAAVPAEGPKSAAEDAAGAEDAPQDRPPVSAGAETTSTALPDTGHAALSSAAGAPDAAPAADGPAAPESSLTEETAPATAEQSAPADAPLPSVVATEGGPRDDATDVPAATPPLPAQDTAPPDAVAAPVPQAGDASGQPPVPPAAPAAGSSGTPEPEEKTMGLMDHLNELRSRLVRCFIAAGVGFVLCWTVVEPIFNFITAPLLNALPEHSTAMYTTLPEPFFVRMFVAFITGLFVASPYIFYQIWAFISPGLYEEEKRGLLPIALLSAVFFIGGGVFCYLIVFPYAFNFFLGFSSAQIQAMPRITDYLDFVIKLLLAFGLIFEMPLFSFFLSRMGVITAQMMRKARRYAILCIFIVAAILTPPDVISQLLMAMPMLLLYEISILVAAAFGRKKKDSKEEDEGTPGDPAPAAAAPGTTAAGDAGTDAAAAAAATAAATAPAWSDDDAQRMPPVEEDTATDAQANAPEAQMDGDAPDATASDAGTAAEAATAPVWSDDDAQRVPPVEEDTATNADAGDAAGTFPAAAHDVQKGPLASGADDDACGVTAAASDHTVTATEFPGPDADTGTAQPEDVPSASAAPASDDMPATDAPAAANATQASGAMPEKDKE